MLQQMARYRLETHFLKAERERSNCVPWADRLAVAAVLNSGTNLECGWWQTSYGFWPHDFWGLVQRGGCVFALLYPVYHGVQALLANSIALVWRSMQGDTDSLGFVSRTLGRCMGRIGCCRWEFIVLLPVFLVGLEMVLCWGGAGKPIDKSSALAWQRNILSMSMPERNQVLTLTLELVSVGIRACWLVHTIMVWSWASGHNFGFHTCG